MRIPVWLEALGQWATVGATIVALILLAQGQRDRRRIRDDSRRAQAEKLTASTTQGDNVGPSNSAYWPGRYLKLHNNSGQPVIHEGSTFVANPASDYRSRGDGLLFNEHHPSPVDGGLILPGATLEVPVPSQYMPTVGIGGDFVIFEFLDVNGVRWRRRTDTFELEQRSQQELTRIQRFVQAADRTVPWLLRPLHRTSGMWVRMAHRRRPQRVSAVVRAVEWLWGYWPPGTDDRWLLPADSNESSLYIV